MAAITRYENIDLINLPDCKDLLENGKCAILNVAFCTGFGCPYYPASDSEERSKNRLCSLDEKTQEHIAQKYYGGARPWVKGCTFQKELSNVSNR